MKHQVASVSRFFGTILFISGTGDPHHIWILSVNGDSNLKGSSVKIVLEGPDNLLIEQYLRFMFKPLTTNLSMKSLLLA